MEQSARVIVDALRTHCTALQDAIGKFECGSLPRLKIPLKTSAYDAELIVERVSGQEAYSAWVHATKNMYFGQLIRQQLLHDFTTFGHLGKCLSGLEYIGALSSTPYTLKLQSKGELGDVVLGCYIAKSFKTNVVIDTDIPIQPILESVKCVTDFNTLDVESVVKLLKGITTT